MSFIIDKKKVEMTLEENTEAFRDSEKMLFGSKFEEVEAELVTSKNKLSELFGNLKEQGT